MFEQSALCFHRKYPSFEHFDEGYRSNIRYVVLKTGKLHLAPAEISLAKSVLENRYKGLAPQPDIADNTHDEDKDNDLKVTKTAKNRFNNYADIYNNILSDYKLIGQIYKCTNPFRSFFQSRFRSR